MSESRLQQENDGEFEKKLSEDISFLPPDDRTMSKITPFKKAMNMVLTGIALNCVVLNFLCLNYILPFIGIVLSVLGFRVLRKENRWFYTCFILNIIKLVHFSVYIASTDYQHVNLNFNDTTYYKHLTWLKQQSIYETNVGIEADSEILVLQTCYFRIADSYLIIAAKKI